MSLIDDIPPEYGYREAIHREAFIRDASFQPVTVNLCGFEVRPMLFLDYLALRTTGSPFVIGGEPEPKHIRAFLWRMSPGYDPDDLKTRRKFMRRCQAFIPPDEPLIKLPFLMSSWARLTVAALDLQGRLLIAIRKYIDESMQDWPSSSGVESVSYYSDGAAIVATISREYHWSERDILQLPMTRLLQYLKEIKQQSGAKVMFNPSDRIRAKWLADQNRN